MPLEWIALIGGALLGIVVAAIVGSLLGRRLRSWRERRAATDGPAATPSTPASAWRSPPSARRPGPRHRWGGRCCCRGHEPERAADPPSVLSPSATIADPLTRSASQRTDGDATFGSSAAFTRRLSDAPPPVTARTLSSVSPAMRDRGGTLFSDAAPAAQPTPASAAITASAAVSPRRDRRRGVVAAIGAAARPGAGRDRGGRGPAACAGGSCRRRHRDARRTARDPGADGRAARRADVPAG